MKPRVSCVHLFAAVLWFPEFISAKKYDREQPYGRKILLCSLAHRTGQGNVSLFPHLSKAEHVRQTKNIREIHAFHASLPPARPSTDDSQDVRTSLHLTTPAPIPCPACIWVKAEGVPGCFLLSEFGDWWLWIRVAATPQIKRANSFLLESGKQML